MFEIAILNPLRFIDTTEINYSFDGDFAVKQVLSYQNPKCYFQKWQLSDVLKLQILSDFVPSDIVFKDVYSDLIIGTASWAPLDTAVVGHTFLVYELVYAFNNLPEGKYYAEFSYTDENAVEHLLISEPMCIQSWQENTLLLQYTNSENNFDVIFDTEIVFNFRVESAIKDYTPGNNRAIYTDQKVNPTLLSATPFRKFKFYLGYQVGFPGWVVDKVNHIQSVDQVSYNGVYYQIPEGAEYETEINDDNSFTGGSIDIQPTDNNFAKYITEPSDSPNTFTPMQKVIPYYNVADNFPVAGFFKAFSVLEKICINKRSIGDIELLVGTTPGGDEVGSFTVDDLAFTQTVEYMFNGTTTLYLTGLDEEDTDCDIFLVYKQLDEPPIDLGGGSDVEAPPIGLGAVVIYEEVNEGDLDLDFDTATGLGRANTDWVGWAMCDGRNGTDDRGGVVPTGLKTTDADFNEIGKRGGSKTHTLTIPQLPVVEVKANGVGHIDGNDNGGGLGYGRPKTKVVDTFGGGQSHPIMQPYLVSLFVKKIA